MHHELFFETGLNEKTHIIDVKCVQQQIGEKESQALIGFHTYTSKQLPKQLPNYYNIMETLLINFYSNYNKYKIL